MHFSRYLTGMAFASSVLTGLGQAAGPEILWWGIPMVIRGPSAPPAPVGVPAPVPPPPAPQPCPASCRVTSTLPAVTRTLPAVTTTMPAVTTTLPAVTTTLPAVTTTTPGIDAAAAAQGSADCAAIDPAQPTPLFNEYGGMACCVPISTMGPGGALVQAC